MKRRKFIRFLGDAAAGAWAFPASAAAAADHRRRGRKPRPASFEHGAATDEFLEQGAGGIEETLRLTGIRLGRKAARHQLQNSLEPAQAA
jgi:hypothetical protein